MLFRSVDGCCSSNFSTKCYFCPCEVGENEMQVSMALDKNRAFGLTCLSCAFELPVDQLIYLHVLIISQGCDYTRRRHHPANGTKS